MKNSVKMHFWLSCLTLWLMAIRLCAHATPDPANPLGFFTTVADKMLRSTFPFGVTNIPVCSNGVQVYMPAVQRLLQLSANIYDAGNSNAFPVVFRPLFGRDAGSNIFIMGYAAVTNVAGPSDPQLATPYRIEDLINLSNSQPIADSNGPVNVYGVPWIIGAKKGLPNFNQLALITTATFTRKLMISRASLDAFTAIYSTNQMYDLGISNFLSVSFWNSYNNSYPRPLQVYAHDVLYEQLTNSTLMVIQPNWHAQFDVNGTVIPAWPGSQWIGILPNSTPQSSSFVNLNWTTNYLPDSICYVADGAPLSFPIFPWTSPGLAQLPPVGLDITNFLQAYVLDGSNVIDYVQLERPACNGNLNQALADPDYPDPFRPMIYYQWSTNGYGQASGIPWGIKNQLWVSGHPNDAPITGGQWSTSPTPMGVNTPMAEAAFFNGFFTPTFVFDGQDYINSQQSIVAPYSPTRTVVAHVLLQANDPLVHYLSSDLNAQSGTLAVWANNYRFFNGSLTKTDDPSFIPKAPPTPIGGRYQPWLRSGQMNALANVIPTTNNYASRDPLVYDSDAWNFPSDVLSSLAGLGQVHRGTPWQTFYLKDVDFLNAFIISWGNTNFIGTNTWRQWTADLDAIDASLMAPLKDHELAGLLMSLLNTNDPSQLFAVNDANVTGWQSLLNGLTVFSNSAPVVFASSPLAFDTYVMDGSSSQAATIANGVAQARGRQSNLNFHSIGDVLATPELSRNSPFLNLGSSSVGKQQMNFGISDWEYEALPSQLLPLLRPDSIGMMTPLNAGGGVSFSGADGYAYVLQASTNLIDWNNVSTNHPTGGSFAVPITSGTNGANCFYRTILLP